MLSKTRSDLAYRGVSDQEILLESPLSRITSNQDEGAGTLVSCEYGAIVGEDKFKDCIKTRRLHDKEE